jgi:hypothetical protein
MGDGQIRLSESLICWHVGDLQGYTAPRRNHHHRRAVVSSLVTSVYVRLRSSVFVLMFWSRSRTLTVFGELLSQLLKIRRFEGWREDRACPGLEEIIGLRWCGACMVASIDPTAYR